MMAFQLNRLFSLHVSTSTSLRPSRISHPTKSPNVSKPVIRKGLISEVAKRHYAIRDRYFFPVTEQEKLAKQLEAEEAERQKVKAEHKALNRAIKSEIKFHTPRPIIEQAGMDVKYPMLETPIQPHNPKSLNIAVIGPANSGKSTWTNRLCGYRISSVSSKPQTTRTQMLGVATFQNTQLVILDTPGLLSNQSSKTVGRNITATAWNALDSADIAVIFMDCVKTIDQTATDLVNNLDKYMKERKQDPELEPLKTILFLNKYDKYLTGHFRTKQKYPVADRFRKHFEHLEDVFDKVLVGSALTGIGMTDLRDLLIENAKDREWIYSHSTKTDASQLDIAFEIIREKLYRHLNQEIPYTIIQENVGWTEDTLRGILRIDQKFYIKKESQRFILHGHMKGIIYEAERDLATALGIKVILRVSIIVRKEAVEPSLTDQVDIFV